MAQAVSARCTQLSEMPEGRLEYVIDSVWETGPSPAFDREAMNDALDTVFSSTARAVERHDRQLLGWLSDRLGTLSARLLRGFQPEPALYFAIYIQALAEITHVMSHDNNAITTVHQRVRSSKHVVPLLTTLQYSPGPMTASQLARKLSLSASNFSNVLKLAADAGVVSYVVSGRTKLCTITRLGAAYTEELSKPITRLASQQLVEQYWTMALHTDDDDAKNAIVRATPEIPADDVRRLLNAATKVDGARVAALEIRDELRPGDTWHVCFKRRAASKQVLKALYVDTELKCEVLSRTDQAVRFRCADKQVGEFTVPYGMYFKEDVSLQKYRARHTLDIKPAGFGAIKKAMQEEARSECLA